jgi:hypothetical protein
MRPNLALRALIVWLREQGVVVSGAGEGGSSL